MNLGTYISKLSASTTVSCSFCLVTPCSPMANHLPEPRGMDTQPAAGATTGNSGFYALTSTLCFGGREVSGMAWTKLEAATLDVLPQSCAGRAILLCLQPPKAQLHLVLQMWHPKACFFLFLSLFYVPEIWAPEFWPDTCCRLLQVAKGGRNSSRSLSCPFAAAV